MRIVPLKSPSQVPARIVPLRPLARSIAALLVLLCFGAHPGGATEEKMSREADGKSDEAGSKEKKEPVDRSSRTQHSITLDGQRIP